MTKHHSTTPSKSSALYGVLGKQDHSTSQVFGNRMLYIKCQHQLRSGLYLNHLESKDFYLWICIYISK